MVLHRCFCLRSQRVKKAVESLVSRELGISKLHDDIEISEVKLGNDLRECVVEYELDSLNSVVQKNTQRSLDIVARKVREKLASTLDLKVSISAPFLCVVFNLVGLSVLAENIFQI